MDAREMLQTGGLASTSKRALVLQALADAGCPVTPQDLLERLGAQLNRVTLYRILDLLVAHGLATRHNAGERAFRYCLRSGPAGHAHFTCMHCGHTECLDSHTLNAGISELLARLPMRVETAEIRFGGVCQECLSN